MDRYGIARDVHDDTLPVQVLDLARRGIIARTTDLALPYVRELVRLANRAAELEDTAEYDPPVFAGVDVR